MGCTPSHSDIANHNAKRGILPVDPGGEVLSLPLLIKNSSSYDLDDLCERKTRVKDHVLENSSDEDKNVNFRSSSEDPSLPELDQEEGENERAVSETEVAISELVESDKHMAEDSKVKRQNSCASEKKDFTSEDKNESGEKQSSKKGKKQKSSRQGKQGRHCKTKEKASLPVREAEKKVDFPDLLVKAHQNAYAYLNPNLSKYEVILCMANQATETQLIVQQMVSFLLLRFDEINHLLEEIAQDGESLLKEVGGNLAWPAGKGNPKEQPDLLQQLLQYTVNKMQLLNGTVSSLTSDALQDSCSFFLNAGYNLEEKLKAKHGFDERLLKMIKLLEASAVGPSHPHPDDMTLYSEDSGIGIDSESVKDLNFIDKQGMQTNCDSSSHVHLSGNQVKKAGDNQWSCQSGFATTRSHDCALEREFKDIFYPPAYTKNVIPASGILPKSTVNFLQHQNIIKPLNSVHCDFPSEDDCFKERESAHASSTNEDSDDNTLSEEEGDIIGLSEQSQDAFPKRRVSLPVATDSKRKLSTKRRDSPENEEIILKMKDAISEKIKFVPVKSGKKEWMEDENGKGSLRPRTATGSQKSRVKQKRSRSEESLKSHTEDPTLLELQRTQKGLNKRLEMFYILNGNKEINKKLIYLNLKEPSNLEDYEHVTHRSSTNKLKASLAKNFSILPNQDKVPVFRHDQIIQPPDEWKCKKDQISRKENEPSGTQKLNSVGCAPPRKSVKTLIETFSPSDSLVKPTNLRTLGPIKCIRRFGLPSIIPPNLPLPRGLVPLNHKHRISPLGDINCRNISPTHSTYGKTDSPILASGSDTNENDDDDDDDDDNDDGDGSEMENLPPPPPEMLMDIIPHSTESSDVGRTVKESSDFAQKISKTNEHCTIKKSTHISPKVKASLCPIELLPSKNLNSSNFIINKARKSAGTDSTLRKYSVELDTTLTSDCHQELASEKDREMQETADLYKQSCKIIPLQNPKEMPEQNGSDAGKKECSAPSALTQKRSSPDSLRKTEKTTGFARRVSPAKTLPSSPTSEKRVPSPPLHCRLTNQASSPTISRQPSPPANHRVSSPPVQRKLPSPPTQQNLSSPPMPRKQQNPPTRRKGSSSPGHRRDASSPPFSVTPSPPPSPSRLHKGLQNNMDSGDEQQLASPKIVSNAGSIFCPATSSLFEAKPMLLPHNITSDGVAGHPEVSAFFRRNSAQLRPYGDQQRKVSFSAANPQPFVKRSFSDRRPGFPVALPFFPAAGSEPVLSQIR